MAKKRTPGGKPTAATRRKHATLPGGRFPIWDIRSARAALRLRGHNTTKAQRRKIINKAARYAPAAAKKARAADRKAKRI